MTTEKCRTKVSANELFRLFMKFLIRNEKLFQFLVHAVCDLGANGLSILIDASPSGSFTIRDALKAQLVPYFNFDYTIQSLVKLMEFYLLHRQAADAVFMFSDEIASGEAFYHFIRASPLRVMIHDPSTFDRLKSFRPVPSNIVLIGPTDSVQRLFRNVRDNLDGKKMWRRSRVSAWWT